MTKIKETHKEIELSEHHMTYQNFIQLFGINSQILTNWIARKKVKSENVKYLFVSVCMINISELNEIPRCYKKRVISVLKRTNTYNKYIHYFKTAFKPDKD